MTEKKKRSFFSRLIFFLLVVIASSMLLLSYAAEIINPAKFWPITIFGIMYLPILILTIILFVFAIIRRSSLTSWLVVLLIPSIFLAGRYIRLGWGDKPEEGPVKVVTYNVGLFANGSKSSKLDSRKALADAAAKYLMSLDADVICLQEFYMDNGIGIDEYLESHFPGYRADYYLLTGNKGHAGNVTLSRFPVRDKGKVGFEKSTNMALFTDVEVNDSISLRIYNCHFESYNLSPDEVIKSIMDEEEVESTGRKMRQAITRRPDQIKAVRSSMAESPYRSMVVGDFNDTPLSYTYQVLKQSRTDAFVKAGRGFSYTYKRFRPFLRIDYILAPKDLDAVTYSSGDADYSDHYPQIASFKPSTKKQSI